MHFNLYFPSHALVMRTLWFQSQFRVQKQFSQVICCMHMRHLVYLGQASNDLYCSATFMQDNLN